MSVTDANSAVGLATSQSSMILGQISDMGVRFDAEVVAQTRSLFEPLWPDNEGLQIETVHYGDNARHVADICAPKGASARPVLLFIPGGGFTGGSRAGYAAFAGQLARQGVVVIVADYRLAPQYGWPAGAEDASRVVEWAGHEVVRFGGDPASMFAFGHSAGATHVAGAIFDARLNPANVRDIKGVVLGSGIYEVSPDEERANILAYFGEDRRLFADRSPNTHASGTPTNVLLFAAELDPPIFINSANTLADTSGRAVRILAGHNHVSTVFAVGTRHDVLGEMILRYNTETLSTA